MVKDVKARVSDVAARREEDVRPVIAVRERLLEVHPWWLDRARLELVCRVVAVFAIVELRILHIGLLVRPA